MGTEFLDLASKAKELGVSEAVLRAHILSEPLLCWIYLANVEAYAEGGDWLPAWTADTFHLVEWIDHGSAFTAASGEYWPPLRLPRYHVRGWVGVAPDRSADILTRGECAFADMPVCVCDDAGKMVCWLRVRVKPKREWVAADSRGYVDGGYWRDMHTTLTAADLFIPAASDSSKPLSSRKEQSYLGIIAAMRALLRDKDGGGFPSEAKIIEQLVERFGTVDGVSKRNLEKVFPDATRAAGDAIPPK